MKHGHRDSLRVLLIDDEPEMRATLAEALDGAGHVVTVVADGSAGLEAVTSSVFDAVITDINLPGVDGLTLFRRVRVEAPDTPVVFMTAYGQVDQAVQALREGAYDYLTKPFEVEALLLRLRHIGEQRSLQRELTQARAALAARDPAMLVVGTSPAIQRTLAKVEMVARSDAPALITGESGTGKELVARMIHERSARQRRPFLAVNCGALTETLMEAELFGHERGAFTGADRKREGRFKAAHGGTIFLDEIAELPLPAQAKLLRVLQEGTFEPLGSNVSIKVDVRVVSATHRDLRARVRANLFREDLYYRINVIEVGLPPLRERAGDLVVLVEHFLRRFTAEGRPVPVVKPEAWEALLSHRYPGNVRELSHAIQHAVVLSGGGQIGIEHLPTSMTATPAEPQQERPMRPLATVMAETEREYILAAVARANGRRAMAAAQLGISLKALSEKLRSCGIKDPESGGGVALV